MKLKLLLFVMLILTCTLNAQQQVDLREFGILTARDATVVVAEALKKVNNKNAVLVFPKGVYNFYPDDAAGKYHAVTNHDNSYKRFAFPLIESKNIVIDGQGSEFIFHGIITPFLVEKASDITIKNVTIDWQQPFYLQATVLESNQQNNTIKVKVNPATPATLIGTNLMFSTNGIDYPNLGENMVFDPQTGAVAYLAQNMLLNARSAPMSATQTGKDEYLIKGRFNRHPASPGMIYVFKGPNTMNRLAPAIHLTSSKNVLMENVTIHHAGGMGIIGERTENIHLNNIRVTLREGTDRIVTTTADATHFCNCKGSLIIENSIFENMLDDATNVHGTYIKISQIVDNHTVRAGVKHHQQFDYVFAEAGDKVNFVHSETLLPIGFGTIKEVRYINERLSEYVFEDPIPSEIKVDDAIDNITWYPETIFRNNIVRNNRARSILISTRNKTIIENNYFSSMMTSILFEGDLDHWYESGSVDDVLIRNNTFGDNVYGGNQGSVIWINPRMKRTDPERPYEKNIRIENNLFKTFDSSILSAKSVDGLVFKNNTIVQTKTYKPIQPHLPTIELKDCLNAVIESNTYQGDKKATIVVNNNSQNGLKLDKKQKGFK